VIWILSIFRTSPALPHPPAIHRPPTSLPTAFLRPSLLSRSILSQPSSDVMLTHPPFSPARLFRALFLIRHCYQRASYPWRVFLPCHPPTLGDECLGLREDPLDRGRIPEEKHIRERRCRANDPRKPRSWLDAICWCTELRRFDIYWSRNDFIGFIRNSNNSSTTWIYFYDKNRKLSIMVEWCED